jgi:hypothetical protein
VVRSGGGTDAASDGGLASTLTATPMDRVRVRAFEGLVRRRWLRGGGGGRHRWWVDGETVVAQPQPRAVEGPDKLTRKKKLSGRDCHVEEDDQSTELLRGGSRGSPLGQPNR